jgi:hypothetical protein
MRHAYPLAALVTGLLLTMGGPTAAAAQSTKMMPAPATLDTGCVDMSRNAGDATNKHLPTDSAGLNRSGAGTNCRGGSQMTMQADSVCQTSSADSVAYSAAEGTAKRKDGMAGRVHQAAPRSNCVQGLGGGIGADSSMWHAPADTTTPQRP